MRNIDRSLHEFVNRQAVIVDRGRIYLHYQNMANLMELSRWEYGRRFPNEEKIEGRVIAARNHEHIISFNEVCLGIELEDGSQFIVSSKGVKILEEAIITSENFKGDFTLRVSIYRCPACRGVWVAPQFKYCPECGIRLVFNLHQEESI